jgi:hypothetical protein
MLSRWTGRVMIEAPVSEMNWSILIPAEYTQCCFGSTLHVEVFIKQHVEKWIWNLETLNVKMCSHLSSECFP